MNKNNSTIIGYFFENETKSGGKNIRVSFPDGTVLFLNYSKDKAGQGVVVLGNGGKSYDLKSADVKVDIQFTAKEDSQAVKKSYQGARSGYKSSFSKKSDSDSPF